MLFEDVHICNPECNAKSIKGACKVCVVNRKPRKKANPYMTSLLNVHALQEAGFTFGNDSFDLGFWKDLAMLKHALNVHRNRPW